MSSVLVVVIVGVIIAVAAAAAVREGPKPATQPAPDHLAAPPEAPPSPEPIPWGVAAEDVTPGGGPVAISSETEVEEEPDERGLLRRARAAALLGLTVVALGLAAATVLGVVVVVGAHVLNRALG